MFEYRTQGVCARTIMLDIEDNIIKDIKFVGGCDGNLQGLSSLAIGMDVDDIIERLSDIKCGPRKTSCPDQLTMALKSFKAQEKKVS